MRSAEELKQIKLTPEQERIRNNFVFNALATVVAMDSNAGRETTSTKSLLELMNIGTDYALDPKGYDINNLKLSE